MQTQLPFSDEAERAILGALILNAQIRPTIMTTVSQGDFYLEKNRKVWDAIVRLVNRNQSVDPVTLDNELRTYGGDDWIGYIGQVIQCTPDEDSATSYAQIVQDKSTRRRLIAVSRQMETLALNEEDDVEAQLGQVESELFAVRQGRNGTHDTRPHSYTSDYLDHFDDLCNQTGSISGLSTGFAKTDAMLNGLEAPYHYVIAGRPGMGKSSLVIGIANELAMDNRRVGLFSLEMSHAQITARRVSMVTGIPLKLVKRPWLLGQRGQTGIRNAAAALAEFPLYIDDTPGLTPTQLRARAMRLKAQFDVELIIIDNLNNMQPDRVRGRTESEVADISKSLSAIYKTLRIPGITVCQLSRNLENRQDKRPILTDLRDSGAIEQEAYGVIFCHRDSYYKGDEDSQPKPAELILAKNRDGETGTDHVTWDPARARYRENGSGRVNGVAKGLLMAESVEENRVSSQGGYREN